MLLESKVVLHQTNATKVKVQCNSRGVLEKNPQVGNIEREDDVARCDWREKRYTKAGVVEDNTKHTHYKSRRRACDCHVAINHS